MRAQNISQIKMKNGNTVYKPTYLTNSLPTKVCINNLQVIIIESVRKGDGIM